MSGIREFSLILDKTTVRCGEKLRGRIHFVRDTNATLHGLRVRVEGSGSAGGQKEKIIGDEFDACVEGFEWEVPVGLPPSLSCRHSSIRYHAQGALHYSVPGRESDVTSGETEFSISPHINLNTLPSVALRQTTTNSGYFRSGLFGPEEPVHIRFVTSRSGFVPGECVLFAVEVNNESGSSFDTPSIQLIQNVTIRKNNIVTSKKCDVLRSTKFGSECRSYRKLLWTERRFRLPAEVVPSLSNFTLMEISYELKVILPGRKSLSATLPVTIGTVPLAELHPEEGERRRRVRESESSDTAEPPPPSYAEITGIVDAITDRGSLDQDDRPPPYSLLDPAGH